MRTRWINAVLCVVAATMSGCATLQLAVSLQTQGYEGQWVKIDPAKTNAPSGSHLYGLLVNGASNIKLLDSELGVPDYVKVEQQGRGSVVSVNNEVVLLYVAKNMAAFADWLNPKETLRRPLDQVPNHALPPDLVAERERQAAEALEKKELARKAAEEKAKEEERAKIAKAEQEWADQKAKEKAEQQVREQTHEKRLREDPKYLFNEKVDGCYAVVKGKMIQCHNLDIRVVQVVDERRILARFRGILGSETIASIVMDDAKNLFDDQAMILRCCARTGTYRYESAFGTKTVAEWTVLSPVKYGEFLDLWNAKKIDVEKLAGSSGSPLWPGETFSED